MVCYGVLFKVSSDYPPVKARLHTCYAPVRRSPSTIIANCYAAPRLACVRPAASVYPEPGSNSPLLMLWFVLRLESNVVFGCFFCTPFPFCFFYSPKVLAFFRQAVLAISFFQGTLWCSASFLRGFFVTHAIIPMAVRLPGICPIAGAKVNRFFYARKFFTRFFFRLPVFFVKPFFNFHTLTNGWQRYGEECNLQVISAHFFTNNIKP